MEDERPRRAHRRKASSGSSASTSRGARKRQRKELRLEPQPAGQERRPDAELVTLSVVSDIILTSSADVIELAEVEDEETEPPGRKIVVRSFDPVAFAEDDIAEGDRLVYLGTMVVTDDVDLEQVNALLRGGERPLSLGFERSIEKRSNLRAVSLRAGPRTPAHAHTAAGADTGEARQQAPQGDPDGDPDADLEDLDDDPGGPGARQQRGRSQGDAAALPGAGAGAGAGVDAAGGASVAAERHVTIVLPEESARSRQARESESSRRPPIRFSKSWEWQMRVSDFPQRQLVDQVWVEHPEHGFVQGAIQRCLRSSLQVVLAGGLQATVSTDSVLPLDSSHLAATASDDSLSDLEPLNEAAALWRLRARFVERRLFYSWMTNSVLLAVHPCEEVEGLFVRAEWPTAEGGVSAPAHLFALADRVAEQARADNNKPQSVLFTGVSGAGKSRNAREMAWHLLEEKMPLAAPKEALQARLVACGIIMQAFCNASTVRCGDSTCMDRLVRLRLREGAVTGLSFERYCLDLDRLVQHSRLERNFHVFYQLCNGWRAVDVGRDLRLGEPSHYAILGPDCLTFRKVTRPHDTKSQRFPLTNKRGLQRTLDAMGVVGMDHSSREDVLRILAAVLCLGNVTFSPREDWKQDAPHGSQTGGALPAAKCAVSPGDSEASLEQAAELLEIEPEELLRCILLKHRNATGKLFHPVPLGVKRATIMRDHLIKHLYSLVVDLLFRAMNEPLEEGEDAVASATAAAAAAVAVGEGDAPKLEAPAGAGQGSSSWINLVETRGFSFALPKGDAATPLPATPVSPSGEAGDDSPGDSPGEDPEVSSSDAASPVSQHQRHPSEGESAASAAGTHTPAAAAPPPLPRVALIASCMNATTESSPAKFSKSRLLSLSALFNNFASEVLEQLCQQAIATSEEQRLRALTGSSSVKESESMRRALRPRTAPIELLVGHPSGIMTLLDQQSLLRGTRPQKDADFVIHLNTVQESNRLYQRAMFGYSSFKVKHYGGELLEYDATGMVSCNARTVSTATQFFDLFDAEKSPVLALLRDVASARRTRESYEKEKLNQHVEAQTVAQQRRRDVAALSEAIESSKVWCVRCVLPNATGRRAHWNGAQVLQQLRYSGLRQLCTARGALFPVRLSSERVASTFGPIARMLAGRELATPQAVLRVFFGDDSEGRLWRTGIIDPDKPTVPSIFLGSKALRVLERTRWKLREHSAVRVQHAMMQLLERSWAARTIQHFVYKTVLDPNYVKQAALRILNGFRMFYVRNDFLLVRAAAVRLQSVARMFLCRSSDQRLDNLVVCIQKVWRGQAIRQRVKMIKVCRAHCANYLGPSQTILRCSLVVQTTAVAALPRPGKRKRQLLLTSRPAPCFKLVDPVAKKVVWSVPWTEDAGMQVLPGEAGGPSELGLEARLEGGMATLGFTERLKAEGLADWAEDVAEPRSVPELVSLRTSFARLADRFMASMFLSGHLHVHMAKRDRMVWKDHFAVLHRSRLHLFKGEEIRVSIPLETLAVVRAVNTVNSVDHNYLEIVVDDMEHDKTVLRASSREERDRWVQGCAWMISLNKSIERLERIHKQRPRSGTLANHAIAISTLRDSGNFSTAAAAALLDAKGRVVQRSLSKLVGAGLGASSTSAASDADGAGEGEDAAQLEQDIGAAEPAEGARLRPRLRHSAGSMRSVRRLWTAKRKILKSRVSRGLYHLMSSTEYLSEHAPRTELQPATPEKRYRQVAGVKLSVGKVDEAMDFFLRGVALREGVLRSFVVEREPKTGLAANGLLVFTDVEKKESRRHRRRRLVAATSNLHESSGALDAEALENDEDGKLLSELLGNLQLLQYYPAFEKEGLTSIRQAKSLSHQDLLDSFNIESFSHRERLVDAFQNYGRIGSALEPPKRSSLRLDQLFHEESAFKEALAPLGLADLHQIFLDNNVTNLDQLRSLSARRLRNMGLSESDRKRVVDGLGRAAGRVGLEALEGEGGGGGGGGGGSAARHNSGADGGADAASGGEADGAGADGPGGAGAGQSASTESTKAGSASRLDSGAGASGASAQGSTLAAGAGAAGLSAALSGGEGKAAGDRTSMDHVAPSPAPAPPSTGAGSQEGRGRPGGGLIRQSSVTFADQVDWVCGVCKQENGGTNAKCMRCASAMPANVSGRLERVQALETCVPWRCSTCKTMNAYSVVFCALCNTRRSSSASAAEEEREFALGDRVRMNVSGVYTVSKGAAGTVIDVDYRKHVCQVQFDDGAPLKVPVDDLRKVERSGPLARLNTVLNMFPKPTLSSPSALLLKKRHPS